MKIIDLSASSTSMIELGVQGLARTLKSSVEINVPVERAWDAFRAFDAWGSWNSFIPAVSGEVKPGEVIEIKVVTPGLKEMAFKPTVFSVKERESLSWGGGFLFLYNGVHDFIFERIDEGKTRFIQIERFEGPMVLFMDTMIRKTALGYIKMNEEFKDYLEKDAR